MNRAEWERRAVEQGRRAVWSVLRDWLKGQLVAVECGVFTAQEAFLPWTLAADGRSVAEIVSEQRLPPPPG